MLINKENFKIYNIYLLFKFISENMQNVRKSYIRDKDGNLKYFQMKKTDYCIKNKKGNVLFY